MSRPPKRPSNRLPLPSPIFMPDKASEAPPLAGSGCLKDFRGRKAAGGPKIASKRAESQSLRSVPMPIDQFAKEMQELAAQAALAPPVELGPMDSAPGNPDVTAAVNKAIQPLTEGLETLRAGVEESN